MFALTCNEDSQCTPIPLFSKILHWDSTEHFQWTESGTLYRTVGAVMIPIKRIRHQLRGWDAWNTKMCFRKKVFSSVSCGQDWRCASISKNSCRENKTPENLMWMLFICRERKRITAPGSHIPARWSWRDKSLPLSGKKIWGQTSAHRSN